MGIRGEIYSTKVSLENRTYFFNVKENRLGDLYLNIVESKNKETGGFERQSVVLFAEDLQDFLKGFDDSLKVMEKAVQEKRRPGGAGRGGRFESEGSRKPRDFDRGTFEPSKKPFDRERKPFDKAWKKDGHGRKPFDKPWESDSRDRGFSDKRQKPFDPNKKPFDRGHKSFDSDEKKFGSERPFKKIVRTGGGYGSHKSSGAGGVKKAARKARTVRVVRKNDEQ